MRIILVARGMRHLAPAVGFLESLIWVTALAAVMQHLDQPLNYVFYAAGFATGFVSVSDVRYAKEGFITPRRTLFPFAPRMREAARKAK